MSDALDNFDRLMTMYEKLKVDHDALKFEWGVMRDERDMAKANQAHVVDELRGVEEEFRLLSNDLGKAILKIERLEARLSTTRAETLEEAAKVADEKANTYDARGALKVQVIAAAIRALKEKP